MFLAVSQQRTVMATADVIVVGGGIVGAACARSLTKRGVAVTLIDYGKHPGVATQASAGMLAPFAEAVPEDPLLALTVRARDFYTQLVPELEEETDVQVGLWLDGIYQVAFTEEEASHARAAIAWQRQSGFSPDWLSAEELSERLPGVGPDAIGAVLAPEDGALDPDALHEALLASARAGGARLVRGVEVRRLVTADGRVTGVETAEQAYDAGAVILAAGCWSGDIVGPPRPVSVHPIRGQMVSLEWPKDEPPAVVYGGGCYVLKRRNEAIAGSTMEHVGFDARVTDEGIARILGAASRIYPALTRARELSRWAGLRPSTPDGRPILGRDPTVENLWYATGHGRNGILLAGLSGELIGQLFTGEPVEHEMAPMDPGRFWTEH